MTQKTKEYAAGPLKFVAILLVLAGILNIVDGAAAIGGDSRFNEDRLLFETLTGWGIAYIIIGLLQIYAAAEVRARKARGLLLAITFACISGIAHFISIGAYPIWSITVMILNFAVLFILLTNDDQF
ncbi:MAG: DUF7144 family membrane protein [Solirubrobacterales bacterium]